MHLLRSNSLAVDTTHASPLRRVAAIAVFGTALLLMAPPLCASARFREHAGDRAGRNGQGYLGITFRDVGDEQVTALKLKDTRGVEVILVDHDGPAFRSGLREHDILLQINSQAIENADQLRRVLHDIPAARTVAFAITRDGQAQTLAVQLANRDTVGQEAWGRHITVPEPASGIMPEWHARSFFGGNARSTTDLSRRSSANVPILNSSYTGALLEILCPQLADFFGAETGLLVREVDPDSPAAVAGLRAGDVVVKINTIAVVSAADWLKIIYDNRGKALPVVVLRDRKEQLLTLTPDAKRRSAVVPLPFPVVDEAPLPALAVMHLSTPTE